MAESLNGSEDEATLRAANRTPLELAREAVMELTTAANSGGMIDKPRVKRLQVELGLLTVEGARSPTQDESDKIVR